MSIRQTASGSSTNGTVDLVWGLPTQIGSTVLLVVASPGASSSVSSIVDGSNIYASVDSESDSGTAVFGQAFLSYQATSVSSLAANISGSTGFNNRIVIAREYTGFPSSALDQHFAHAATGANPSATTPSTTQANELVIGWIVYAASAREASSGAGFGNGYPPNTVSWIGIQAAIEDMSVSGIGAQTATWLSSTSQTYLAGALTLKATGVTTGPSGPLPHEIENMSYLSNFSVQVR